MDGLGEGHRLRRACGQAKALQYCHSQEDGCSSAQEMGCEKGEIWVIDHVSQALAAVAA